MEAAEFVDYLVKKLSSKRAVPWRNIYWTFSFLYIYMGCHFRDI